MQKEDLLSYKKSNLVLIIPLSLILYFVSIYFLPTLFVDDIVSLWQGNSTIAQMHVDLANSISTFFLTFGYVILTYFLVIQSKETIAQSKKEQQIRDIEHRLEKFYLPVIDIVNIAKKYKEFCPHKFLRGYEINLGTESDPIYVKSKGFDEISEYRYLAEKDTLVKVESILLMKNEFPKNKQLMFDEIKNLKTLLDNDRDKYMIKLQNLNK